MLGFLAFPSLESPPAADHPDMINRLTSDRVPSLP
jgi:hypothetical protein